MFERKQYRNARAATVAHTNRDAGIIPRARVLSQLSAYLSTRSNRPWLRLYTDCTILTGRISTCNTVPATIVVETLWRQERARILKNAGAERHTGIPTWAHTCT